MYALNKRFRLTEYWGMSSLTIGAAVGGLILMITSIGFWIQVKAPFLAIAIFVIGLMCMRFAYKIHLNNKHHRINSTMFVGKRDMSAKTMEVYFG